MNNLISYTFRRPVVKFTSLKWYFHRVFLSLFLLSLTVHSSQGRVKEGEKALTNGGAWRKQRNSIGTALLVDCCVRPVVEIALTLRILHGQERPLGRDDEEAENDAHVVSE